MKEKKYLHNIIIDLSNIIIKKFDTKMRDFYYDAGLIEYYVTCEFNCAHGLVLENISEYAPVYHIIEDEFDNMYDQLNNAKLPNSSPLDNDY